MLTHWMDLRALQQTANLGNRSIASSRHDEVCLATCATLVALDRDACNRLNVIPKHTDGGHAARGAELGTKLARVSKHRPPALLQPRLVCQNIKSRSLIRSERVRGPQLVPRRVGREECAQPRIH